MRHEPEDTASCIEGHGDPREYVMGECGDGSTALCCGWCSLAVPNHLPWCDEQAASAPTSEQPADADREG